MKRIAKRLPPRAKSFLKSLPIRFNSKSRVRTYMKSTDNKKLHLGCGTNILPGWLNTDIVSFGYHVVVYMDAAKKYPFENETFNYVFSEHVFEHLTFDQQLALLQESYRVLKPGGVIRIATPDFDFLDRLYHDPEDELHKAYINWAIGRFCPSVDAHITPSPDNVIYVINNFHIAWSHKIIHNFNSLQQLLSYVGFKTVTRQSVSNSEHADLRNIEGHGLKMPPAFNLLETIIVEAER